MQIRNPIISHPKGYHTDQAVPAAFVNVASGIAGLDAGAKLPLAQLGGITDTQISATAAIAKTKLAALNIVDADVNAAAAIAKTKLASLAIVDADVSAGAAIAVSKLAYVPLRHATTSWAGNSAVNRAIAHGITTIKTVLVQNTTNGGMAKLSRDNNDGNWYWYATYNTGANSRLSVTAPDGTNFYVGNATQLDTSVNNTGATYTADIIGV